jgi:phage tail sheath protein FI
MNVVIESIKSHIKRIRESFVGEPNTISTWNKVEQDIETYLNQLVADQVIEPDYMCVCDSTNNTPFTIHHNVLITSVYAVRDGLVYDVGGSSGQEAWEEAMAIAATKMRYFD